MPFSALQTLRIEIPSFITILAGVIQLRPDAPDVFAPQTDRSSLFVCPACGGGFLTETAMRAHRGYGVS